MILLSRQHKSLILKLLPLALLIPPDVVNTQYWEYQNSNTTANLVDVHFVDAMTGWAIGDSAVIIYTEDGGNNWSLQSSPVDSIQFERVQFVNDQVGYIIGHHGIILSTKNGGQTWCVDSTKVDKKLVDLSFINADTGWAAGYTHPPHGSHNPVESCLLVTYNGGNTWEVLWGTDNLPGEYHPVFLHDIDFQDQDTGYAIINPEWEDWGPAMLFSTTDGGQTWDSLSTTIDEGWHHILSVFGDTVWVSSLFTPNISFNGGIDWQSVPNFPDSLLSRTDAGLLNGRTCWVLGHAHSGSVILFTDDMGSSWTSILLNQKPWISAVYVLGENDIWAVGDSGIVMHYRGAVIALEPGQDNSPQSFLQAQNYPNPFNPVSTIRYDLPQSTIVSLIVYDILGREVARLVDGHMEPGYHQAIWNGRDITGRELPSCIYIARLVTPEYTTSIKMVLLK